tara:strand:+ start:401 stop:1066 length:666 start_codon:yes stop_codon:yes gene_type:complete
VEKVNYITHLNIVFEQFNMDDRIKQGHITLYLAFFQKWNRKFFKKTITINRERIMERAKFKSKTTYHSYIKDLNDWGYLRYFPSYSPAKGSKVQMTIFFALDGQKLVNSVPEQGQNLVHYKKHKTTEKLYKLTRPKNEQVVLEFFEENKWPAFEGKKFYAYYKARNWELSRGLKIKNWKTAATNYIDKGLNIKEEKAFTDSGLEDNLRKYDNKNKDYTIPL